MRLALGFWLLILSVSASAAPAKGGWVSRDCEVLVTGCDWLFANSDIVATLSDSDGQKTEHPSHLRILNFGQMPCYFSGTGAGGPLDSRVEPGQEVRDYLAISRGDNTPLQTFTTTFRFWKGPFPGEKADAAKKRADLVARQKQAEKQRENQKLPRQEPIQDVQRLERQRLASQQWDLWLADRQKEAQENVRAATQRTEEAARATQQIVLEEERQRETEKSARQTELDAKNQETADAKAKLRLHIARFFPTTAWNGDKLSIEGYLHRWDLSVANSLSIFVQGETQARFVVALQNIEAESVGFQTGRPSNFYAPHISFRFKNQKEDSFLELPHGTSETLGGELARAFQILVSAAQESPN